MTASGFLFKRGNVLTGGKKLKNVSVAVEGSRITALGKEAERKGRRRARQLKTIDLGGSYLAPGFIDLHTHGASGVDFDSADEKEIAGVLRDHYLAHGVTRVLISLCPRPRRELLANVRRITAALRNGAGAGVAAGIHLEGPFLNPQKPGALAGENFCTYKPEYLDALLDAGEGMVRTMTIAPERRGGDQLIAHLRKRRVIPAFGHSGAAYEDARRAIKSGVRYVTHLFNAMEPLHHRQPGPVSAFLEDEKVSVEIISDGHHVDPAVLSWVARVKQPETICLVSDSMSACGLAPGRYRFGKNWVRLRDGKVTLSDGTLAGSAVSLDDAFRIQVRKVGLAPETVAVYSSQSPARIVNWHRQVGEVAVGKLANLVVLSPRLKVQQTYLGGERVF